MLESVLKLLQCEVGCYTAQGLEEIDNVRLYHPARKGSDKEKKARKCQRAVGKGLIDAAVEVDAPGAFLDS